MPKMQTLGTLASTWAAYQEAVHLVRSTTQCAKPRRVKCPYIQLALGIVPCKRGICNQLLSRYTRRKIYIERHMYYIICCALCCLLPRRFSSRPDSICCCGLCITRSISTQVDDFVVLPPFGYFPCDSCLCSYIVH